MEDRLKKIRRSMEMSAFKELSFTEKMRKEIHKRINTSEETEEIVIFSILQLLLHEKTGYELTGLLRARGIKKFEENEGSLYTMLHKLEQNRLIASLWKEDEAKFYQISDRGKKFLRKQEKSTSANSIQIKGLLEE